MRLSIIGGGVMGEAIIAGVLTQQLTSAEAITVSDTSPQRRALLSQKYGVLTTSNNREALANGDIIILAIKPQTLPQVMAELKGLAQPQQVILSIVAGATIATLEASLGHHLLVRVMPNTPAQIGEGMSVWTSTQDVEEEHKAAVRSILGALGREIYVPEESYIDMATAVSASGPAYIFLLIEALIDAAVHIGMPRDMAEVCVLQMILGSARFALSLGQHPAQLRNMVTSPGGTTTEGLLRLEEGGFRALLIQAVIAAYEKALSLGGER
ncbi:MAG: pyrroline-5-carboxylate reductase [Chloroflexi bacterium]|nr:pyrroline-5-carboxylate reductase [Chloroflexota bacterium]